MIDAIKTLRNIDLEQVLRPKFDALKDRRDGIPTRATGPKPIEVGRQFGFPLRFQDLAHEGLSRPFMKSWNSKWPLFRGAPFWNPNAPERGGFAIEFELMGQLESLGWFE
jgi:hypothetical protein